MRRVLTPLAILGALLFAAVSYAGPITKQNGRSPVISRFTPICAVPGYANYGYCGGQTTTFANVAGRMNAIQAKPGRYNLEFSFSGLTPGVAYRLWSTRDAATWTEVGRMVATDKGSLEFSLQTTTPGGLGFDLNTLDPDVTVVTSWWSGQKLVVNADTSLSTAA